jgi:hypothetical protein
VEIISYETGPAVRSASLVEQREFEMFGLFCAPDIQERLVSQEIFNAAIRKKHTEEFSATRFIGTAFPKISAFRNGLTEAKDPKRTGVSNLLCRFLGGVEPRIR